METLSWSTIGEGGARGGKMAAAAAAALALVLVLVRVVVLVLVPGPRSSLLGRGAGGGAGAVPALAGVCVGAGAGAIQSIQPTSSEVSPGVGLGLLVAVPLGLACAQRDGPALCSQSQLLADGPGSIVANSGAEAGRGRGAAGEASRVDAGPPVVVWCHRTRELGRGWDESMPAASLTSLR